MLDSTKHNLRAKVLNCIQDGTNEILQKTNNLEQHISDTSNHITEKLNNITNRSIEKNYISSEYLLDSFYTLNQKKPRVLICGYYGARNLGDELMLQSLLKHLDSKKLDITIMLAPQLETDASFYAPYNVIHYPSRNDDILLLAKNYDYIIWGGGAVLDDDGYYFNYLNNTLGYILLKTSLAALKYNKKVYVLGVSTNQILHDQSFISDLNTVISQANYFSLRDTNSFKTLKTAGIDTKKISIIDDLAISNIPSLAIKTHPDVITVSMTFIFTNDNLYKIQSFIKHTISSLKQDNPHKKIVIHFTPFFECNNYDENHYLEIIDYLTSFDFQNATYIIDPFPNNVEDLLSIYSQCNFVCSMRYHATLIASICGIKTLSIDFSKIHRHYYNKLKYIEDNYQKFVKIDFNKIDDKEAVNNAISLTLTQPIKKLDLKKIQFPSVIKTIK